MILADQEESRRNSLFVAKVKVFENVMTDKDPTVCEHHWEFYTHQHFVPFRICLQRQKHESSRSRGGKGGAVIRLL